MLDNLINKLKENKTIWNKYQYLLKEESIAAKTILLKEGETSKNIYFVKEGCLRLWFNNEGKDVTFQFFFENRAVSSFFGRGPSMFNLESIEPSVIVKLKKSDFDTLLMTVPEFKDGFLEIVLQRMENYAKLFLSRIKDNPQKRYLELLENNPQIIQRVPQHYIASYLGITPVSLSRIRNKK